MHHSDRWRRFATVAALHAATLLPAMPATARATQAGDASCAELARLAIGEIERTSPACVVAMPPVGPNLTVAGIAFPASAIASRILFMPAEGDTIVVAWLVAPAADRARILRHATGAGATVTAVHAFVAGATPELVAIHLHRRGDSRAAAAFLREALGPPGRPSSGPAAGTGQNGIVAGIPCVRLALALREDEQAVTRGPGYCRILVRGETATVSLGGVTAPADLLLPSGVHLRQSNDRTSATLVASLTVRSSAVGRAFDSLVGAGLDVVAWHTAVLGEQPALAVLHVQSNGNPLMLVESLRVAIDAAQEAGGSSGSGGPVSRMR